MSTQGLFLEGRGLLTVPNPPHWGHASVSVISLGTWLWTDAAVLLFPWPGIPG